MHNYIPATIKCFWCNGKMTVGGPSRMGSGLNDVCGGIAHFARYDDKQPIKTFKVEYNVTH